MPRELRLQIPSGTYHVNASACTGRALFADSVDKNSFEEILAGVVSRLEWSCLSYCLMTTHYHLLVTTPCGDLAIGMQRLNGLYASSYNHRHGSSGHVFKARYHSEFIQTDSHLLEAARYIALNPVRAGLCEGPAGWPWSSYAETIGLRSPRAFLDVEWILRVFSNELKLARARFQTFTEDRLDAVSHDRIRQAS